MNKNYGQWISVKKGGLPVLEGGGSIFESRHVKCLFITRRSLDIKCGLLCYNRQQDGSYTPAHAAVATHLDVAVLFNLDEIIAYLLIPPFPSISAMRPDQQSAWRYSLMGDEDIKADPEG